MKPLRKQLIEEIDAFCDREKMSASRFGKEVMNDKSFLTRLKNDDTKLFDTTIDRVRKFIAEYGADKTKSRQRKRA